MMTDRLSWVNPLMPVDVLCPLCANDAGNTVFLRVGVDAQAVSGSCAVEVARCGCCASVWFPDWS
jgi:hypothetical protein